VGGSGLYVKALTHGLAAAPEADPTLREKWNAMSLDELRSQLIEFDPEAARKIDIKNRRRLVRALEICVLTGKPVSAVVPARADRGQPPSTIPARGVFVYRDREELYARINQRVEGIFEHGVIEEVRAAGATSATASQMIGLRDIRQLLDGKISISQCVAAIQQATRRYAKRQLTWFRRQTNFFPLNLSLLSHNEAVKWILLRMRSEPRRVSEVRTRDD
jgi:tRNA dimethylallyltransferase